MGKASSAKKVARAARAGGTKTGQRRPMGFPLAVVAIVVLGLGMVAFARVSTEVAADSENSPKVGEHWHAAYGVWVCDRFVTDLGDATPDALGIHTHQEGLMHIHPFQAAGAGKQATLAKFFDQTGLKVSNSSIRLPKGKTYDGRTYEEGKTTCGGKPAQVRVAQWKSALEAAKGAKATKVFTSDIGGIRLSEDLGAYTIAFAPSGARIPPPPAAADILSKATVDQQAAPGGEGGQPGAGQVPIGEGDPSATSTP